MVFDLLKTKSENKNTIQPMPNPPRVFFGVFSGLGGAWDIKLQSSAGSGAAVQPPRGFGRCGALGDLFQPLADWGGLGV